MRKHPQANCEECPFNEIGEYRGKTTDRHGEITVVTGQPYDSELFAGSFFDSNAGQLLSKVLHNAGVNHDRCNHIYSVGCKAPEGKKISAAVINACRPRVLHEIVAIGTSQLLALGSEAVQSVGPGGSTSAARVGPAKRSLYAGIPVVSSVSPYLVMMQGGKFNDLVSDTKKLTATEIKFEKPKYVVVEDEQEALQYLTDCLNSAIIYTDPTLVIDIECVIDKEESFGHPENYDMLCIGIKFDEDDVHVITDNALTIDVYKKLSKLMHQSVIIAHNGKFDLNGLRPMVGNQSLGGDTMLASYVFDERAGAGNYHGLKPLSQEFLGAPPYDDELDKYIKKGGKKDFSLAPRDLLYEYNAYDVHCTYLLNKMYDEQLSKQENSDLSNLYMFLLDASDFLAEIEYNGFAIDEDYIEVLANELEHKIDYNQYMLAKKAFKVTPCGYDAKIGGINPNSPKQLKEFLNDLDISVDSTNVETIEKILNYDGKFPKQDKLVRNFCTRLLEYRADKKLKSTYVDGISSRIYKGRVHTTYLLHGTTTGRLSSRNPNLQNIPRQSPVKGMFVASNPDNVIVNVDYSQAELRAVTWFAKEPYFQEIFNDPTRDVFDELVPQLFPGSNKALDDPKEFKEKRTMVKTYVYGLNYGRTEFGIARGFGIPVDLAKKHKQRFFSTIPNIIKWQEDVKRKVLTGEDLVTPYGRHRRYTLITDENRQNTLNEALAFLPQSTASDMCVYAGIHCNRVFTSGIGLSFNLIIKPKIVNIVHDALMVECHKDDAEKVGQFVSKAMLDSAQRVVGNYVKFATDYSYAYSWKDIT